MGKDACRASTCRSCTEAEQVPRAESAKMVETAKDFILEEV